MVWCDGLHADDGGNSARGLWLVTGLHKRGWCVRFWAGFGERVQEGGRGVIVVIVAAHVRAGSRCAAGSGAGTRSAGRRHTLTPVDTGKQRPTRAATQTLERPPEHRLAQSLARGLSHRL